MLPARMKVPWLATILLLSICTLALSELPSSLENEQSNDGTEWTLNCDGVCNATVVNSTRTERLIASHFNLNIPSNATIEYVTVNITRRCGTEGNCADAEVFLRYNNMSSVNAYDAESNWTTASAPKSYRHNLSEWNLIDFNSTEFNSENFSVVIRAQSIELANFTIDSVELHVEYSVPNATSNSTSGTSDTTGTATSHMTSDTSTSATSDTSTSSDDTTSTSTATSLLSTTVADDDDSAGITDQDSDSLGGLGLVGVVVLAVIGFGLVIVLFASCLIVSRRKRTYRAGFKRATMENGDASLSSTELGSLGIMRPPSVILPEVNPAELAIPLKDLAARIEKLKNTNGFEAEFNYIEQKTAHHISIVDLASAQDSINFPKNRYRNVLPPEATRVKLAQLNDDLKSDYINANYIGGLVPGSHRAYIATQGPVVTTVNDFWRMVWETNASVILNLTKDVESGRQKCEKYWPESDVKFLSEHFEVVLKEQKEEIGGLVVRKLDLIKLETNETRPITQFHNIAWPDHGIPESTYSYLSMSGEADKANATDGPLIVHCSAGIGRTGTFCTIHSVLELVKLKLTEPGSKIEDFKIDIAETVIKIREQRTNMVQTPEQYEFCYCAIRDGVAALLGMEPKIQIQIQPRSASEASTTSTGSEINISLQISVDSSAPLYKPKDKPKESSSKLKISSKSASGASEKSKSSHKSKSPRSDRKSRSPKSSKKNKKNKKKVLEDSSSDEEEYSSSSSESSKEDSYAYESSSNSDESSSDSSEDEE